MPIISQFKRSLVFLVLFMILFLPNVSHAYDLKEITSSKLKDIISGKSDKVLAVIFLTTENHFYQEHLPDLNNIYEKYRKKNVELIGVLLGDKTKEVKDFIGKKGVDFPIFRAEDEEEMRYIFTIRKIPLVHYYKNGKLKHKEDGYTEPDHLEEDLRSCLEGLEPHLKGTESTAK